MAAGVTQTGLFQGDGPKPTKQEIQSELRSALAIYKKNNIELIICEVNMKEIKNINRPFKKIEPLKIPCIVLLLQACFMLSDSSDTRFFFSYENCIYKKCGFHSQILRTF